MLSGAEDTGLKVTHIFTHIKLTLCICKIFTEEAPSHDGFYVKADNLGNYALSTLMKKVFTKVK